MRSFEIATDGSRGNVAHLIFSGNLEKIEDLREQLWVSKRSRILNGKKRVVVTTSEDWEFKSNIATSLVKVCVTRFFNQEFPGVELHFELGFKRKMVAA